MRVFSVIILLTALVLPTLAFAEIQTFTTTHTYVLGDDDSRNSARQRCLSEAKRKILEQVGVYLESKSELITSSQSTTSGSAKSPQTTNEERQQITDQINTLAAGVMRSEVIKEEFGEVNGRLQITLTVKAHVDPDDIQKQLAAKRADQGVRKQVAEQQQRIEELENQLRAMMKEMRTAGGSERRGLPDVVTIREEARKGDADAQAYLGAMYVIGEGVPQSDSEAVFWFRKSAEQGNVDGQFALGMMYALGKGVPQDDAQAVVWYRKAAEQGNVHGQFVLGTWYALGRGVPQDDAQAFAWYRKAAAQGNAQGQATLGWIYALGIGVPQDDAQAVVWLRKAAEQGNADGQAALGNMYRHGRGVPRDDTEAARWFNRAAQQGNAGAQNNLGYMYLSGSGVPKDEKVGIEWIRKAAEQPDEAIGKDSLGVMYRDGRGVPRDNMRAYMWFDLAVQLYLQQGRESKETVKRRDPSFGFPLKVTVASA